MLLQYSILSDLIKWIYQIIFVTYFSFPKDQQTFKIKPVNMQSRSPKTLMKKDLQISISVVTLNSNIYLYSYKTETVIFIASKHEKTIMAVI